MSLPPPSTGVEQYLAAILDELRARRGGGQVQGNGPQPVDGMDVKPIARILPVDPPELDGGA